MNNPQVSKRQVLTLWVVVALFSILTVINLLMIHRNNVTIPLIAETIDQIVEANQSQQRFIDSVFILDE